MSFFLLLSKINRLIPSLQDLKLDLPQTLTAPLPLEPSLKGALMSFLGKVKIRNKMPIRNGDLLIQRMKFSFCM